ncbi:lichenan permease IIC component [Clostridium puniceum]|uniref:Permease IIC component n=1 Tax=Clostridium puniceum TaxID=29367 RepID=A0A1S8T7R4_9CLOT|nr:PTS transporter subunit EIIC [Clostridium puniceum]OOM73702.1 lichenan permease IIC component [Clostridium puniceum]
MKKLLNWMETSLSPKMNKINNNIWIVTLKDSINQVMPLIFLGSIFSMLTLPKTAFKFEWWPAFGTLNGWCMGLISLMIAFLIPFNLMEKSKLRQSRIVAGVSGIILFAIVISPQLTADKAIGFTHSAFGAGGMFIAIATSFITGLILRTFGKFSFFKEDSVIPDFVKAWFDQMLPVATIIISGWIVVNIIGFDFYNTVLYIFSPLQYISETLWGFVLIELITVALYSMGISAWVLTPIVTPIKLAAITANMAGAATNMFTFSFVYGHIRIGGVGSTLILVILLCCSKSTKLKALGRAGIIPSVFNINEPIVFGAIVWNPILMIPMIINGLIIPAIAFIFTKIIPFAKIPDIAFQLWYCPYPISTWLASSGTITNIILVVILAVISGVIWYPFFKIYEKQCLSEEQLEVKNN